MGTLLSRLDDKINPIVVKELRQAVNGRFIAAVLLMFLTISVITMAISLIAMDEANVSMNAGQWVMQILNGILVGLCLLFLPGYAAIRMGGEYSDTNVDLMFITTIKPRAIIWGKLLSAGIVVVLIYATCMPFMTLTYLLRGIDLPTIFFVLAMGFVAVIASVQLAIFTACVTTSRGFRVLLGMGLLGALVMVFVYVVGISIAIAAEGLMSGVDEGTFWAGIGSVAVFLGSWVLLLYTWSVALISPPFSNRMLPVRVTMVGVWLFNSAIMLAWAIWEQSGELLTAWAITSSLYFWLFILIAVCERTEWSVRVARTIPQNRIRRIFAMLFYSGAAGGLTLAWLLLGIMVAVLIVAESLVIDSGAEFDMTDRLLISVGLFLYCYAYAMTGMFVRRMGLEKLVKQEHTWALAFVLGALGCALPPLFAYFLSRTPWNQSYNTWMLANPAALLDSSSLRISAFVLITVWAILVTSLGAPWYFNQLARFKPPEPTGGDRSA